MADGHRGWVPSSIEGRWARDALLEEDYFSSLDLRINDLCRVGDVFCMNLWIAIVSTHTLIFPVTAFAMTIWRNSLSRSISLFVRSATFELSATATLRI